MVLNVTQLVQHMNVNRGDIMNEFDGISHGSGSGISHGSGCGANHGAGGGISPDWDL